MPTQRISVRVPDKIAQRLKERSRMSGAGESAVVREALEKYLSNSADERTAYDLAREAGLIGCVQDAPKDLSTNRRHFKGFGKAK